MVRNTSGFTLIELLTYMSLAGVVFLGLDYLFLRSTDIYVDVLSSSTLVQNAHTASEMLEREIKSVRNKTSIVTATATQFKFTNTSNSLIDLVYASGQIKKIPLCTAAASQVFRSATINGMEPSGHPHHLQIR